MKLWEVFRFEVHHHLRRWSVWVYAVALLGLVFQTVSEMASAVDDELYVNTPAEVFEYLGLAGLFALIVTAALTGDAATRDVHARMEPLLYTAPLGKWTLLGGRFLGVFVLNALLLLLAAAVVAVAVRAGGAPPEQVAPFRAAAYVRPYLMLVFPNLFIGAVLLFTAALVSRRAVMSYVAGTVFFVGTVFHLGITAQTLGQYGLAAHLDAFGFSAASYLLKSWTPLQESTQLVPFTGWLVSNRLLWLGIAVAVGLLAGRRFRLAHHAPRRTWHQGAWRGARAVRSGQAGPDVIRPADAPIPVPHAARAFNVAGRTRQAVAVARRAFWQIVRGWGWMPPVGLALLLVLVGPELMEHLGVPLMPTTARVLSVFAATSVPIFVTALIAFYAGELVWADRDVGVDALVDAAPVPDGALLLGKLLALGLVVVVIQALLAAAGLTLQVILDYTVFEPGLYLSVLFGLQLTDYLLFTVLAVTVHVLVNQKYAGHLVVLLAYVFTLAASYVGVEHHLLVYGGAPAWTYTEVSGFGASLRPVFLFKLYWTGWALLLALAARLVWVRGAEQGLRQRLRRARRGFTGPAARWAGAAVAIVLISGGFVFYNTNVLNDYYAADERAAWRTTYEKRYGRYEGAEQPHVMAARLDVELYPEQREATVRGTYSLVNGTDAAIDTLHLATASEVETGPVTFDREAEAMHVDDDLGHRIYQLARPLQPDDTLQMQFALRYAPRGFTNRGAEAAVLDNGTFFTTNDWLPQIGYQWERELQPARERAAHGLPPRPAVRPLDDVTGRHDRTGRVRVALDMTIGTATGQTAVAPGARRQTWIEDGRRYVRYVSDAPVRAEVPILSARYAVREARWRDVDIEVFYPPGRPWNLDRIVRSVQASLEAFAEWFGRYPYDQLKVVAAPDAGMGATAYPGLITVRDGLVAMRPDRDRRDIDFLFAVMAHEVAHQWWGHQLVPALVEGAPVLTESLAWYSALGVVEETHGPEHLRRLLDRMREAYLAPRPESGVPLLRAVDSFDAYRKGPLAMHALREYLGTERVNTALRRLLEQHGSDEPPYPTSLELYRELRTVAPDSLHGLLEDLFARNTFWDLAAERATAEPTGTGVWRVTLDVSVRKVAVDSVGVETAIPMHDLVEVGVFGAAKDDTPDEPLYLRMHRIRSGEQTITVTVPREPARAGIDPRRLLIDTEGGDNTVEVQVSRRAGQHDAR